MSNYEGFKERLARQRAEAVQRKVLEELSLEQRITQWWGGLNEDEKAAGYPMVFFVSRFKDTPPRLGAALFSLGWTRKRCWKVGEPHRRVWVAGK